MIHAARVVENSQRRGDPVFRFGAISDIQYADCDDGCSFSGQRRYYRAALPSLERAVSCWNTASVDFAVQCGDIVDGLNRKTNQSGTALDRVLTRLKALDVECKHVLGNHCTCQLSRATLLEKLSMKDPIGYYSFSPAPQWKCLVLDTSDIALYAWPEGHPHHTAAVEILKRHNPNAVWNDPSLLEGAERRFVSYNGAIGTTQLSWLRSELEAAEKLDERVLVFTHIPISPVGVLPECILWNFEEVQSLLREYASQVQTVFSGHVHAWIYSQDTFGIHYLTLPGVVEAPPESEAHGIVEVYRSELLVHGFGRRKPYRMTFAL